MGPKVSRIRGMGLMILEMEIQVGDLIKMSS